MLAKKVAQRLTEGASIKSLCISVFSQRLSVTYICHAKIAKNEPGPFHLLRFTQSWMIYWSFFHLA